MDRNNYYGGESASYNLNQVRGPAGGGEGCGPTGSARRPAAHARCTQLWEKYRPGEAVPKDLGRSNEYNVDAARGRAGAVRPPAALLPLTAAARADPQVPKFIMSGGKMVQMLIHTDVARAGEHWQRHS